MSGTNEMNKNGCTVLCRGRWMRQCRSIWQGLRREERGSKQVANTTFCPACFKLQCMLRGMLMGETTQLSSALYVRLCIVASCLLFIVTEGVGMLNWWSSSNGGQTLAFGLLLLVLVTGSVARDMYSNIVVQFWWHLEPSLPNAGWK